MALFPISDKEDQKILDRPRVLNIERTNIFEPMASIILLLKRTFFVVMITLLMRRFYQNNDQTLINKLIPRNISSFILTLFNWNDYDCLPRSPLFNY